MKSKSETDWAAAAQGLDLIVILVGAVLIAYCSGQFATMGSVRGVRDYAPAL